MINGRNGGRIQVVGPDAEIRFPDGTVKPFSKHALMAAIDERKPVIGEGIQIAFLEKGAVHIFLGELVFDVFPENRLYAELSKTS